MTLDEAIKYYKHRYEESRNFYKYLLDIDEAQFASDYESIAEEYKQTAEWLTDYKELKNSVGAVKLELLKEAQAELEKRGNILHDTIAELEEAKRLLKAAVEDMKTLVRCDSVQDCLVCKHQLGNCDGFAFEWKHMEDVNNLINPIE